MPAPPPTEPATPESPQPLTRAEELSAVILHMLRQDCAQNQDRDSLDSYATSAYEGAILTLAEDGYVELDTEGRIGATVTAKGNELEARMDIHERRKRIMDARQRLGAIPGMTPEKLARLYNITVAELIGNDHERLDERSLALHQLVAQKVQADPALLDKARENVRRWQAANGSPSLAFVEWEQILSSPVDQVAAFLVECSERATRLRQSSPFCGILTEAERRTIFESFRA